MGIEERNLEGIHGWLILVAIGIIVTPVRLISGVMGRYHAFFDQFVAGDTTSLWERLTIQGSGSYSPLLAPLIIGEMIINVGLTGAHLYMAYLFFSKKAVFTKWFIGLAAFSLIFMIADAFALKLVQPSQPWFGPAATRELTILLAAVIWIPSLFAVVVWIPYMLISKRVKATFVHE